MKKERKSGLLFALVSLIIIACGSNPSSVAPEGIVPEHIENDSLEVKIIDINPSLYEDGKKRD